MIHLGQAVMPLDGLRLPGDWKQILREPGVEKLAASQKYVGPIHPPIVRASTKEILAGRRRVAAYFARGEENILVDLVECTDQEREIISLAENAVREHNLKRQGDDTSTIVKRLTEFELQAAPELAHTTRGIKGASAAAKRKFAEIEGVQPETIKKRMQRERKAEREANLPEPEPIESPWCELDDRWRGRVTEVKRKTLSLAKLCEQVVTAAKVLREVQTENGAPMVQELRVSRLLEDASTLSSMAHGLLPEMLCPNCKGQTDAQKLCATCHKTGYITRNQRGTIPKEMMDEARPMIRFGDKLMTLAEYLGEESIPEELEPDVPLPTPVPTPPENRFGLED